MGDIVMLLMEDTVDYQVVSPDGELTIFPSIGGFNSTGTQILVSTNLLIFLR